jgi:hypothetical protein
VDSHPGNGHFEAALSGDYAVKIPLYVLDVSPQFLARTCNSCKNEAFSAWPASAKACKGKRLPLHVLAAGLFHAGRRLERFARVHAI